MKRAILTLQVIFLFVCLATASEKPDNDTTFYFNDKVVEVDDNDDQVDIRVFKKIGEGDSMEYKSVYKGVFSDDKTIEKYTVFEDLGFSIPIIGDKKKTLRIKAPGVWCPIGMDFQWVTATWFRKPTRMDTNWPASMV